MTKNEIIERLGANSWKQVKNEYVGRSVDEITADLEYMWPHETEANQELANAIYNALN